jgi:hypothetical protein
LEMESKDKLSHSKRHDADGGRHRFIWGHGRKFLRAGRGKRAQVVGPKRSWRDWRGRYYLFGQGNTKDRRCKRTHRSSVANRNHNCQGINTWIGVGSLRASGWQYQPAIATRPMICVSRRCKHCAYSPHRPVSVICMRLGLSLTLLSTRRRTIRSTPMIGCSTKWKNGHVTERRSIACFTPVITWRGRVSYSWMQSSIGRGSG